jgi:hypothetical protein
MTNKVIQEDLSKYTPEQQEYIKKLMDTKATVEVPGVKVIVTHDDTWQNIGMIVVLVLAIYAGVKIVNKLLDRW